MSDASTPLVYTGLLRSTKPLLGPPSMIGKDPIVVVGAGIGGLVAAHTLRRAGQEVLVLEAGVRSGGRVQTVIDGPWVTESGPHLFSGMPPEALMMLEELGVARLLPAAGADRRFLIQDGGLVAVPATTAEMLSTSLLSVAGRLRLLREPFIPKGNADRESVAAFVRRRMGTEFSQRFIEPVVAAAYAGDPTALLAKYAFAESVRYEAGAGSILKGRMRASRTARREGRRVVPAWTCERGSGALPARLAAALGEDLHLNAEVAEVVWSGSAGWQVTQHDGTVHSAAGVVVTVGAAALGRGLVVGLPHTLALSDFAAMPVAPTVSLSLGFRREDIRHPLDGHGVVGPVDGGAGFRSCVFVSSLFPERAPAGHVLLTVQLGSVSDRDVAMISTEALTTRTLASLTGLLGITAQPCFVARSAGAALVPQPLDGHDRFLARADAIETDLPGIVFCGRWRDGVTEGALARGGGEAGQRLLMRLGGREHGIPRSD
ncbi:MAG: protoporphyrinogen oxidase [Gemmatimonadota bacterium]